MQRFLVKYNLHGSFKFIAKFGVPCILFINLILDLLAITDLYQNNYDRIVEVTGFGLLVLLFLFVDGILREKCMFFHLSILGLAIHNFVNIYYFGNYDNEYYKAMLIVPELIIALFVIVFMDKENETTYGTH
jgi:hypothetical protein